MVACILLSKREFLMYLAGRGRSAAIALCYLLRNYTLNLNEAQKLLLAKRQQVLLAVKDFLCSVSYI